MSDDNGTPATENDSTLQPATPATSQGTNEGQQSTEKMLTQTEVDRIVGERVKRAEKSVTSGILEALGVDSLDTLKTTLEADRKRKEAEMSETEKLQNQLDSLRQSIAEKDAALEAAEAARREERRDSNLLQLLGKAYDKDAALILIKARHADEVNALMEDGTFNTGNAEKLIAEFQKNNPVLFQSSSPGSPSNWDGRIPDPAKETIEKASKDWLNRLRS